MITIEHAGPLVYGGAVTLAKWYDGKRAVTPTLWKSCATWTYLGIGIASLVATIWWRKYQTWTDKLTSGFLFGLPGFIYDAAKTLNTTTGSQANAVAQAQQILAQRRAAAALGAGGAQVGRTYEQQFNTVSLT